MRLDFVIDADTEPFFPFGFHLAADVWKSYRVAELLDQNASSQPGASVLAVRRLALRVNRRHSEAAHARDPIAAGDLVVLGTIEEVFRYVMSMYLRHDNPAVLARGLKWAEGRTGGAAVQQSPGAFVELFPPEAVVREGRDPGTFVEDISRTYFAPAANRERAVEEMILLFLAVANPACKPLLELFDDAPLRRRAPYVPLVDALEKFFATQAPLAELGETLFDALRAPMRDSPDSLEGQLDFIRRKWARFLPTWLVERLATARDMFEEEKRLRGFGPGEIPVMRFTPDDLAVGELEYEAFSRDADWMANVVLIAKSSFVWLDQLSKQYGRPIATLADIPDRELDRLAHWGFNGLWLIGLWERSAASRTIKRMMGNPEAESSAYSLYDYDIARDLGGAAAYDNLRERCRRRGIRLASDMVPNHMGLFSRWVVEHPDWFVQTDWAPYPSYSFTGPDLSTDDRVSLLIEDGYWDRRDAAVVFKWQGRQDGRTRFIYHGNDGTNMPWNDTAQLNFLLPEVREAVIQTILHVARMFPIIRFDAAMTLAKRHYQRLWFPPPGEGGAIPSRAERGLTREDFDRAFPKEFWREVVDRVAAEAPDTLLLAEAFWLMEGYFVRTLGMHRVYNSAFMNMLKMEENAKYRETVKNVLEFSPPVLGRFVNFMNNPDEETAVAQFGKDDKYIGTCVLMVTMPGLPMFGHGQVEGFTEKYGMEYRRAYWDEQPDEHLIRRHEAEVFPLMRRRYLFSRTENFAFFDFQASDGGVHENVFAYTNRVGGERTLVLYNNAYAGAAGWVRESTPINVGPADAPELVTHGLAQALALRTEDHVYYVFRDSATGRQFVRGGRQIAQEGFYADLRGYQYLVFVDFREVEDFDGSWRELAIRLAGGGVRDIEETYREVQLEPVLAPWRNVFTVDLVRAANPDETALASFIDRASAFYDAARRLAPELNDGAFSADALRAVLTPFAPAATVPTRAMLAWAVWSRLGAPTPAGDASAKSDAAARFGDQWLLRKALAESFRAGDQDEYAAYRDALLVRVLVGHAPRFEEIAADAAAWLEILLADPAVREYLRVNRYEGVDYLDKDRLEVLFAALESTADTTMRDAAAADKNAVVRRASVARVLATASATGYRIDRLLAEIEAAADHEPKPEKPLDGQGSFE